MKKLLSVIAAAALAMTSFASLALTASADGESDYTITIPSTLSVANSGWNSIGDIEVSGTLSENKKLILTASSENDWALKSDSNSVSYTMKETAEGSKTTSWEFTSLPSTQAIGIVVEDYSEKPVGTYTDTVTFTAENAVIPVSDVSLDKTSLELTEGGNTATLTATVHPDNAADKTVIWSSDNEAVATVVDGVVTPVAAGTAIITAMAGDKTAACAVTVKAPTASDALINGNTLQIKARVTSWGSTITKTWEYSDGNFSLIKSEKNDSKDINYSLSASGDIITLTIRYNSYTKTVSINTANNTYSESGSGNATWVSRIVWDTFVVNGKDIKNTLTKV